MAGAPPKAIIMNILDILRRYSDEDHRLNQRDVIDILRSEYGIQVDRKTVRRNILTLINCGYDIEYSESVRSVLNRKTGKMEESYIWSNFYLVREFSDSELHLLIDGLLFSKHIPHGRCRELVEKLEGLSSIYFNSHIGNILMAPGSFPPNQQMFYTIEVLDEAISQKRKVSFNYVSFGQDKKLHKRLTEEGEPKEYVVSPYQMVAANGRYYLISNTDPHDDISHYRVDRIMDIQMLQEPLRSTNNVAGLENGLNLPKHMAEHLYMFSGESAPVTFKMKKHILNDVIDWFGTDIRFVDEDEEWLTARTEVNLRAMRIWSIQYGPYVKIISPQSLVDDVVAGLRSALEHYSEE